MIASEKEHGENKPVETPVAASGSYHVSLFDVWGLIRRRKWLIAFGLGAGLVLSCLYYFRATPIYESEVELLVMQKDSDLPTQGTQGSDFQGQRMYEDLLSTHIQIFRSPRIIKQAIEKHQLASLPSIAEQMKENDMDPPECISEQLEVTKGGGGRAKDAHVLHASFRGPSPEDCEIVLSALVESYQDFLGTTFEDTSKEAVTLISEAKVEIGEELKKDEAAYREFREQAPLLWKGEEGTNLNQQRWAEIEKSLAVISDQRTETKARLAVIEEALNNENAKGYTDLDKLSLLSDKDVERLSLLLAVSRGSSLTEAFMADQPTRDESARTEYQRLLSLLLEEKTLLQTYGPDHPKVKTVQKQIKATQEFLEKNSPEPKQMAALDAGDLLEANVGLLRHDLSELEKRRTELENLAREEEAAAKELVKYELQGETMASALARKTELYDTVIARLREINLIKDYGGYLTEIISPVELPKKPVAPRLVLVLAVGCLLGMFVGTGLAYVVDMADRTFRNPEELHDALQLPIMGQVPPLMAPNGKAAVSVVEGAGPQMDNNLVTYHRPKSRSAEAFRGLRTAIYFSAHGKNCTVIQVTSPNPGDGKTTVVANLAVAMAQSGKKVLLVDCDFRKPRQHKMFGAKAEVGLSNVIVGEVDLHHAIQEETIENLSFLPAGPPPPNPSELLTRPEFERFLEVVREQYDFVLLDSPPLLAVSDPSVIAPRMDGVLLVVRISKNGRPQAVQAKQLLAGMGIHVLGVVVNGWHQDANYGYGGYGYRYGYGNKYGYGYGNEYGVSYEDAYGDHVETTEETSTASASSVDRAKSVKGWFRRRT